MKSFVLAMGIVLFFTVNVSSEINLDIAGSSVEILNPTTFRVRSITASSLDFPSGEYWADFQWDPSLYFFIPINYGLESDIDPTTKALMLTGQWFLTEKMSSLLFPEELNFSSLIDTPTLPATTKCLSGINSAGRSAVGCYDAVLSLWVAVSINSATSSFDDSFSFHINGQNITDGCFYLHYRSDGHLSNCYPLYGFKQSGTPRLLNVSSAGSDNRQQLFKEMLLEQDVDEGYVDSNIVKNIDKLKGLLLTQ